MAGSGGSSIVPIVLIGGAGYLAYKMFLSPATIAAQASGTPSGSTAAPASAPPVAFNTPDQIYQRLVANATQSNPGFAKAPSSFAQTPYQWKFYLDQVTSTPAGLDFSQMFPGQVNPDGTPTQTPNLTLGQFWTAIAPWLSKNVPGLSGVAGGRGLAGYILSRRRAG
jgi:hypothetical protein